MNITIDMTQITNFAQQLGAVPAQVQRGINSALASIGFALKTQAKKAVNANAFGWPDVSAMTLATRAFPATSGERISSDRIRTAKEASKFLKKTTGLGSLVSMRERMQPNYVARNVSQRLWGALAGLCSYSVDKTSGVLTFGFFVGAFGKKYAWTKKPKGTVGTINRGIKNQGQKVFRANIIGQPVITLARKLTDGFSHTITSSRQQRYYAALGFRFKANTVLRIPARPLVEPTFEILRSQIPTMLEQKFSANLLRYLRGETLKAAA